MTKGQIETNISEAIIEFEREFMGREPIEISTNIIKDAIFVRLKGVLTPAEEQLAKTLEGAESIKKIRIQLLEGAIVLLRNIIVETTGCRIKNLHSYISVKTGERIIIFVLDRNLEMKFV